MQVQATQTFKWLPLPTEVHFGYGALDQIPDIMAERNVQRLLVTTDRGVVESGILKHLTARLDRAGVVYEIYDRVQPDGGSELVKEATAYLKEIRAEGVLGIGGGSSMDTAKAVAAMATNPGDITDYAGLGKVKEEPLPIFAVPTTSGTGSEVSFWSVLTDDRTKDKIGVGGVEMFPDVAFCDPELTISLPKGLTASTGMDALTHAIESYTNNATQPISNALSIRAIELIGRHLRTAVTNPQHREARYCVMLGSTLAGMAMNPTRLGISHALAMPLGSRGLKVPHGYCNAIVLPHVMEFNVVANIPRFIDVARALGEPLAGLSEREQAQRSVAAVRSLSEDVGVPPGLSAFGVSEDVVDWVVEEAMKSGNIVVNTRKCTAAEVKEILRKSL